MPDIVIGFVVGRGPLAHLITEEEKEDLLPGQPEPLPTHCYVRDGQWEWSIEAVFPRVRLVPPGAYRSPRIAREYAFSLPLLAYARVRAGAQYSLGQRYNLLGLLACWLYMERRWRWAVPLIPWEFCSQLALGLLRDGDIDACPGLERQDCSPAHLEGWVASSGLATRLVDGS